MRLIDADKLIEQLYQDSPDPEGVDDWIKIINAQPTETLEQIKSEIREKSKYLKERARTQDVPEHILTAHGLDFALDIINEHLSELKPS